MKKKVTITFFIFSFCGEKASIRYRTGETAGDFFQDTIREADVSICSSFSLLSETIKIIEITLPFYKSNKDTKTIKSDKTFWERSSRSNIKGGSVVVVAVCFSMLSILLFFLNGADGFSALNEILGQMFQ